MSGPPEVAPVEDAPAKRSARTNVVLFGATLLSVFHAGAMLEVSSHGVKVTSQSQLIVEALKHLHWGWPFAVPLMAILLTHEFGHYFAAMYHRVPASLPYFIPLPAVGLFGTMGAVISMPERIRSRNALLDIGAAGPLAGMVVAIPVLVIGLMQSEVKEITGHGLLEGQCLLYSLLKRVVLGEVPAGYDVFLTSTALAGWVGLLITMLNLIPIGQLDGGHIAYALFGEKHNRYAGWLHKGLLGAFGYNLVMHRSAVPGMVWVVWFGLLLLLKKLSGGVWHPPTDFGAKLSPGRRAIAIACMVLFVLLFMPTPMREY
jgi:membrane-associated protease RseP (regulator of RpoE activity)